MEVARTKFQKFQLTSAGANPENGSNAEDENSPGARGAGCPRADDSVRRTRETGRASMNLRALLEGMRKVDASDLHLKVGSPPILRIYSRLRPLDHPRIASEEMRETLDAILPERLRPIFEKNGVADFAHEASETLRFRAAAFHQRGEVGLTFRSVAVASSSAWARSWRCASLSWIDRSSTISSRLAL